MVDWHILADLDKKVRILFKRYVILRRGVHVKAVFSRFNVSLMRISHWRFKQSKTSLLIHKSQCLVNCLVKFENFWEE